MNLTRAQITELQTSTNTLGSFAGDRLPSIQQDNLEPGEYTIQFQVIEPPVDGLGFAAYAYVVWKVGGQQISRIINVFNGSAISSVADSAHVQLQDQSRRGFVSFSGTFSVTNGSANITSSTVHTLKSGQLIQFASQPGIFYTVSSGMNGTTATLSTPYTGTTNAATGAFALSTYKVAVALSRGTRATTMQPPVLITTNSTGVPANSITLIPFPLAEAGVISALITVTSAVAAEAEKGNAQFLDAAGNVIASYQPNEFSGWYPVPPGSVNLRFINGSTTDTLFFSLQWGIEG